MTKAPSEVASVRLEMGRCKAAEGRAGAYVRLRSQGEPLRGGDTDGGTSLMAVWEKHFRSGYSKCKGPEVGRQRLVVTVTAAPARSLEFIEHRGRQGQDGV